MPNTITLQDLRNQFYAIINEVETSTTYPVVLADALINKAQAMICSGWVVNHQTKEQLKKTALPFIDKDKQYTLVADQDLTVDAIVWGTTLTVSSTTGYSSSGSLWINGNIVTYTAKTATQFTWIPATGDGSIEFAFLWGQAVSQLYPLPSDFATSARVTYNGQYQVPYVDYRNLFLQLKNYKAYVGNNDAFSTNTLQSRFWINPFYTIVHWSYILPFQLSVSDKQLWLQYEKVPLYMTATTDLATIPDTWSRVTIPYIAVSEMLLNRWEEARGEILNNNLWYASVMSMYEYFARQAAENMFWQRTATSYDFWVNI